jgi:hypothetical protein
MSQETREYLKQRYGMSNWGSPGFDLSQEDRLEAASEFLDDLFNDFSDYLIGDGSLFEPTTADEHQMSLYDLDVEPECTPSHDYPPAPEAPNLKVSLVQIWSIDADASPSPYRVTSHTFRGEDYANVAGFAQDGSVGVMLTRHDGSVVVESFPRETYGITWTQVPA